MIKKPWRISGICGILFVVLSLTAAGINTLPPDYHHDKLIINSWFSIHGGWYRFGHFLAGLTFLLFYFPFFSGFCERLRIAEGRPGIWWRVTWAGAIISPLAGTISGAFIMASALLEDGLSPYTARFSMAANFYALTVSGAYNGITLLGAAMVILKTRLFRSWLAWSGLIIGVAAISGTGALMENDPKGIWSAISGFAWLAYFLWLGVISVEMVPVRHRNH